MSEGPFCAACADWPYETTRHACDTEKTIAALRAALETVGGRCSAAERERDAALDLLADVDRAWREGEPVPVERIRALLHDAGRSLEWPREGT